MISSYQLGEFVASLVHPEQNLCAGDGGSGEFRAAVKAFLMGLDANDKDRAVAVGVAAYDEYVTSLPSFLRRAGRPAVEVTIRNFINDWTQ